MLANINTCTVSGVEAVPVSVEIYMREGQLPGICTVGLPDASVRESKDRIFAAMSNSGYPFPLHRITINLAPANLRKEGTAFDLPIAVSMLKAMGVIRRQNLQDTVIVGELSLDGKIRPVRGVLPIAAGMMKFGWRKIIVPVENVREAAIVDNIQVFGVRDLKETVEFINQEISLEPCKSPSVDLSDSEMSIPRDLSDVRGQEYAKRAMEVAAAGGHNLLMIGPPGSGKTMLARRIPTILPALTLDESLQITKIHSITGLLNRNRGIVTARPFRTPHHSISDAGLIGGGSYPMPGEVSLAHHGVLFLDELSEFRRHVLEVMRQPLEDGQVTIARAQMTLTYPARFMLVAAMNPCPCGWRTHPEKMCRCTPHQIERYLNRISGPLLDRIDIQIEVPPVQFRDLTRDRDGEPSSVVRKRVETARAIQLDRFEYHRTGGNPESPADQENRQLFANAQMGAREIRDFCRLDTASGQLIEKAMQSLGLSARAYHRILKVARTIADLDAARDIKPQHIAEAIQYRALDRKT